MPTINQGWDNRNELRSLPLDEGGTMLSDAGLLLPYNILVGLRLAYPDDLGMFPYVASVGVTPHRVSLTLAVSTSLVGGTHSPLAVVGVNQKSFVEGKPYPLQPQISGVGGWVAFGSGGDGTSPFSGVFSSPEATRLAPRSYWAYQRLPVLDVSVFDQTEQLTGLVLLKAEDPLEFVVEDRDVNSQTRPVLVLRVAQQITSDEAGPLESLLGECDRRAESGNCGDPEPIEFLNGVQPDCDSNIIVEFSGCATIAAGPTPSSITVACGFGLSEACIPKKIPDPDGTLPSTATDLCSPAPLISSPAAAAQPEEVTTQSVLAFDLEEREEIVTELPYSTDFLAADPNWSSIVGDFNYSPGAGTGLRTSRQTVALGRHVAIWKPWDGETTFKHVRGDFEFQADSRGAIARNFGLILSSTARTESPARFFLLEVDFFQKKLQILRGSGQKVRDLGAFRVLSLRNSGFPGERYRLTAEILPAEPGVVGISGLLEGPGGFFATIGPYKTKDYYPDIGCFGVHANRCLVTCDHFSLEDTR